MADGDREHLFRDDGGAALERAARLQEENSELRAEIERLKQFGPHAPPNARRDTPTLRTARSKSQVASLFLFCVGAGVGIAAALKVSMATQEPDDISPAPIAVPILTAPPVMTTTDPPLPAPAPTLEVEDCAAPFYYDTSGVKHYKAHCLKR